MRGCNGELTGLIGKDGEVWLEYESRDGGEAFPLCRAELFGAESVAAMCKGVELGILYTELPGEWARVLFVPGHVDELDGDALSRAATVWSRVL